jgi:secreted PhoX family phosphatase
VSSHAGGPDAEDEEDRSAADHGGQVWAYDPHRGTLRLVVRFERDDDFEGPDNITVSSHGYAVMCTDGDDADQFLAGIKPRGRTFPLAHNRLSDEEFAGATFSSDGETLFVNVQVPGTTFAIWGHGAERRRMTIPVGLWRSLVAHLTGGQGVAGSSPASPTR